jgi:hypothetical protein
MTHRPPQSISQFAAMTEEDYIRVVSAILNNLVPKHGLQRVALTIGCSTKTVGNARDHGSKIQAHSLLNLLLLDPAALDPLMSHFGIRTAPVDVADGPGLELLADTAKLLAIHGAALSDGRIDHREAHVLTEAAKPVVQGWAAFSARKAVA